MRVVLFGAEEVAQPDPPGGAFGGNSYANNHRAELADHVLTKASFGTDRIYRVALPQAAGSEFAKAALRVLTPIGVLLEPQLPDGCGHGRRAVGEGGRTGFSCWVRTARTLLRHSHHTADDTLDKVDRGQLDQNVAAWAALVWLAADSDIDFHTRASPAPQS